MKQTKSSTLLKKTALTAAVAVAIGTSNFTDTAYADNYVFSFSGVFTMLTSTGAGVQNAVAPYYYDATWGYGQRTQITGTLTYDDVAGTGTMTIAPFSFQAGTIAGGDPAAATGITVAAIGDGLGGSGNLMLGNMLFNWHGTNGIPVSIVWDASGLFGAFGPSLTPGSVITGSGVYPASNGFFQGSYPIGLSPLATTTWNTTTIPGAGMGTNPSGTTPVIADTTLVTGYDINQTTAGYQTCTDQSTAAGNQCALGVGGSPMVAGPFMGFNANFDIISMTVSSKNGVSGPPSVVSTLPSNGTTSFSINSGVSVTFSQNMTASTVAAGGAFTLVETATSTPVSGTVAPSSGTTASTFTFTPSAPLKYSTQYTVTLATSIQDAVGQNLPATYTWSFTTQAQPVATSCTAASQVPQGSNFTMLTPTGIPFGGTNDVVYAWDGTFNTAVSGAGSTNFNMTIASALPQPFFGFPWTAHHIRVFGPGTYKFNTDCTTAQLEAGTCTENADPSKNITMTVGSGQIGAHMLFNWNVSANIDVVNVWNQNALWNDPDGTGVSKNNLWVGERWEGPAGFTVNPATTWALVSTDNDGNGINGVPMIDGPFIGYNANFNLGPTNSCVLAAPSVSSASEVSKVSGGCSISSFTVNLSERADWWLLAGFVAWLGVARRRFKRQHQA